MRKDSPREGERSPVAAGERLTFRAELMPGSVTQASGLYEVKRLLPNGRIELANLEGQHSLAEFEAVTKLGTARSKPGLKSSSG